METAKRSAQACIACGSDMLGSDRCSFCYRLTPELQGPTLYPSAGNFLRQASKRPTVVIGPRSKFKAIASAFADMGCLRLVHYTRANGSIYAVTPYGTEVARHVAG